MEGLNFLANIVIIIENITISFLFFIFILHNAHIVKSPTANAKLAKVLEETIFRGVKV